MIVEDKKVEVLSVFPVMYSGWECDDKGYLVELENGEKKIVLTNHGRAYFAKKSEIDQKIYEYRSVLRMTRNVLKEVFGDQ